MYMAFFNHYIYFKGVRRNKALGRCRASIECSMLEFVEEMETSAARVYVSTPTSGGCGIQGLYHVRRTTSLVVGTFVSRGTGLNFIMSTSPSHRYAVIYPPNCATLSVQVHSLQSCVLRGGRDLVDVVHPPERLSNQLSKCRTIFQDWCNCPESVAIARALSGPSSLCICTRYSCAGGQVQHGSIQPSGHPVSASR